MKHAIFIFFLFGSICAAQKADYKSILKQMDSLHRVELDTGVQMMDTERSYFLNIYRFMDLVYDDLLESNGSKNVEKQQMEWLKLYELESSKIWNPLIKQEDQAIQLGVDDRMIAYGEQADLIYKRILVLLDQF